MYSPVVGSIAELVEASQVAGVFHAPIPEALDVKELLLPFVVF
jgi:hypothetical protein